MTPDILLSVLFVFVVAAGYAVFHRVSNATLSFTWASKTSHPEPSDAETAKLVAERDEARGEVARMRAGIDALPPGLREEVSVEIVKGRA